MKMKGGLGFTSNFQPKLLCWENCFQVFRAISVLQSQTQSMISGGGGECLNSFICVTIPSREYAQVTSCDQLAENGECAAYWSAWPVFGLLASLEPSERERRGDRTPLTHRGTGEGLPLRCWGILNGRIVCEGNKCAVSRTKASFSDRTQPEAV